ncbi:hypothetical protein SCOCK_20164 [Actinacidiphila cocklensis]|uniref:Uncharacterized protein n=1 Tax=Actinacidiphila cocklensis TaxID=887465 RepID=A0A9W4GQ83_9ACTN|nr:hypothetical protein SCOCK_20164 [Actinacidiphila cocklensis]
MDDFRLAKKSLDVPQDVVSAPPYRPESLVRDPATAQPAGGMATLRGRDDVQVPQHHLFGWTGPEQ